MTFALIPKLLRVKSLLLGLAFCAVTSPLVAQQDFFVSPFGDDLAGDGSSTAPFRTVTKANSAALTPGDRVLISPGSYDPTSGEIFPIILGDGVSLIGPTTGIASLDGSGVLIPILVIGTSSAPVHIEQLRILGDGVIIQVFGNPAELQVVDCSFLGGRRAIDRDFPGDTSTLTVERCSFLDMDEYGILWKVTSSGIGSLAVNVRDCIFTGKNLSASGIEVSGIGGTVFSLDILRNSVEKFKTGLRLAINGASSDASFTGLVANNSFRKEDGSGIEVRLDTLGPGVATATMDVAFLYNLLEKNGDFGAEFRSTANGADSSCFLTSQLQGNTVQLNAKSGLFFRESLILGGSSIMIPDLGGGSSGSIGGNTFVLNDNLYQSGAEFDLRLESDDDISAQGNWWFVLSSAAVVIQGIPFLESEMSAHILDGNDNPFTGLADTSNYLFGDLRFDPSPLRVVATGNSPLTLASKAGSLFVPGAGVLPSTVQVNGIPILLFTVSPAGHFLDFTLPSIDLLGGGPANATVTLPAGQTGSTTLNVVRTTDKGRLECFVATAAFGSPMTEELDVLRAWRDDVLMESPIGRWAVSKYYLYSPPLAGWIAQSPKRRAMARTILMPLIKYIQATQGKRPFILTCPF
ncbi:MAG: DUF1565 domain-containing protein [Planctomycetota bacterium]